MTAEIRPSVQGAGKAWRAHGVHLTGRIEKKGHYFPGGCLSPPLIDAIATHGANQKQAA